MTVPAIPKHLVDQIVAHNCVLFVGAGLSQGAGLPSWPSLLQRMMDWAAEHGVNMADRAELDKYLKEKDLLLLADEMRERLGGEHFRAFMVDVFRRPDLRPTNIHRLLPTIPFIAALTSNYDKLLETAYTLINGVGPHVFTQNQYPELAAAQRTQEFYILKRGLDIT
jgi:hypothetical protein